MTCSDPMSLADATDCRDHQASVDPMVCRETTVSGDTMVRGGRIFCCDSRTGCSDPKSSGARPAVE